MLTGLASRLLPEVRTGNSYVGDMPLFAAHAIHLVIELIILSLVCLGLILFRAMFVELTLRSLFRLQCLMPCLKSTLLILFGVLHYYLWCRRDKFAISLTVYRHT